MSKLHLDSSAGSKFVSLVATLTGSDVERVSEATPAADAAVRLFFGLHLI